MEPLNLNNKKSELLRAMNTQMRAIGEFVPVRIDNEEEGIYHLNRIRDYIDGALDRDYYAAMLLDAAGWLENRLGNKHPKLAGSYNPTFDVRRNEADLSGECNDEIIFAAVIDPHETPTAEVSMKMEEKMEMLSQHYDCDLYYFVRSERMEFHARNKALRMKSRVNVIYAEEAII